MRVHSRRGDTAARWIAALPRSHRAGGGHGQSSLTDEERSAAIDRQAVPDKINLAVSELLRANQRLDASAPATLAIVITHFRLRSWASAFWLGAMAGADRLGVEVRLEKDGNTLKEYRTETSSVLGGIIFAGAGHRFNRLLKTIAKRIVDGL